MGKEIQCSPSKPRTRSVTAPTSPDKTKKEESRSKELNIDTKQRSEIEQTKIERRKSLRGKNGQSISSDEKLGMEETESDFPLVNTLEMNKGELTVLMMKLLKMLTVKGSISLRTKPKWWPEDIQWGVLESLSTLELVTVIKKCYEAYGKENLVTSVCVRTPAVESANLKKDTTWKTATMTKSTDINHPQSPIIRRSPKEPYLPFAVEIYICYFCEKEFVDKEAMRNHQKYCIERPPELVLSSSLRSVDICNGSFEPPIISPKSSILRVDVNRKYVPLKEFVGYLDLVPSQTASKIKAQRKCSEISSDILDETEPLSPSIPQTPRTPKSLISQLSRDEPAGIAKKRLSYSLSVEKSCEKNRNDLEDESSDTETDMETEKPKSTNLLNIPLCSLLGQKIQKYVQVDTSFPVLSNSESFCKTPTKNSFLEKLRKKPTLYPITYKPRRVAKYEKQNHLYKFTAKERKDFYWKLVTGLDSNSRKHLRKLKKSSVRLKRLTVDTILKWMPKGKMERQLFKRYERICDKSKTNETSIDEFPSGPTLLSKNMDKLLGLRRSSKYGSALSLSNYVSEYIDAEVSKLQLTLYKCLLHEMSVLKPTVMINDLHPNIEQKCQETILTKVGQLESAKQLTKHVMPCDSVLNMSDSQHDKHVVSKKLSKTQHEDVKLVSNKTPTIRHMLTSPSLKERQTENKSNERKETDSRSISPQKTTAKLVNNAASSKVHSPGTCDENVSVISLSSDSDSFGSDCCMNCKGGGVKKISANLDEVGSKSSRTVNLRPNSSNKLDYADLTIDVDVNKELLLKKAEKAEKTAYNYAMPSPCSSSEASMNITTPPTTPIKVEPVECLNRLRSITRSAKKCEDSNLTEAKKPDKLEKQSSQIINMISDQLNGPETRSKSMTPSSSPKKNTQPSNASLPNTPRIQKSEGTESDVLQLSSGKSGRLLRNTVSKLRSLESTPISKQGSSFALRPRNLSVSSPAKLSPIKSMPSLSVFKSNHQFNDVSNSSTDRLVKRLRSLDNDMEITLLKRPRRSSSCSPRK